MSGSGTSPAAGSAGTGKTPAATETPKGAQHNCQTFHCNFCHHLAKEPMLSYCGHLFCWSCLHQKLETKSSPSVGSTTPSTKRATNESVKSTIAVSKATHSPVISIPCPVCSVNIDENQIVPMYSKDADVGNKKPKLAAKPRPRIGPLQAVNPDSRTTDLIIVAWFVFLVGVWYFLL